MIVRRVEHRGELTLDIPVDRLLDVCGFLRDHEGYDLLSDVTVVDYLGYTGEVAGYWGGDGRDINRDSHSGKRKVPDPAGPKRFGVSATFAKVMTVTNEAYLVSIGMVSKVWFDKLPADLQKVIMDEGRAMVPAVQSFANGYEDQMYKRWTDAGGQVVNLSAGDRTELMKRMEGVGPKVVGDKPAVKAMYDRMVAAAARIK